MAARNRNPNNCVDFEYCVYRALLHHTGCGYPVPRLWSYPEGTQLVDGIEYEFLARGDDSNWLLLKADAGTVIEPNGGYYIYPICGSGAHAARLYFSRNPEVTFGPCAFTDELYPLLDKGSHLEGCTAFYGDPNAIAHGNHRPYFEATAPSALIDALPGMFESTQNKALFGIPEEVEPVVDTDETFLIADAVPNDEGYIRDDGMVVRSQPPSPVSDRTPNPPMDTFLSPPPEDLPMPKQIHDFRPHMTAPVYSVPIHVHLDVSVTADLMSTDSYAGRVNMDSVSSLETFLMRKYKLD